MSLPTYDWWELPGSKMAEEGRERRLASVCKEKGLGHFRKGFNLFRREKV